MLKTIRLKPNPTGKDRTRHGATAAQLAAEWVDIQNTGKQAVDVTGVVVMHVAYRPGASQGHWEKVLSLPKVVLASGRVIRIHAGQTRPAGVIRPEDLAGADIHLFTGEDRYIWNNDRADCSSLWLPGKNDPFDKAWYAEKPAEGAILLRSGDWLVG